MYGVSLELVYEHTEVFCSFVFPILDYDDTFVKIHPFGMYCILFLVFI